ncbi:MAG: bifunctional (p)ppGpp synthetase/guanosine-3',5'-bis(diphosphate) 3'-pyrophosphohydrolase [Bacteroidales bacterium]|nr:bifunctional (p)ppGpp synthetase/guanosine-3',5'-bis(diphosphate) 3'-pyrophosphohydrolase [Bacteroidales bacterium]
MAEFTQEELDRIQQEYEALMDAARKRCANEWELSQVQKAFDFVNNASLGTRRRGSVPYILHPLAVARIVVEKISLGYKSICAALLHDLVEESDYMLDDIRTQFGDKVASLVDGLAKIRTVLDKEDKAKEVSTQAENFKCILLTLNDDVRVLLIKLADRLDNCRSLELLPKYKREKILSETMFIFIPLAHRLGLYEIKSEMENIWLRFTEPEAYEEISRGVEEKMAMAHLEIERFINPIQQALEKAGLHFMIKRRIKTPYSCWHKIQTKGVTFDQIYDIYAIRIIFDDKCETIDEERAICYNIFSIITSMYPYKPDRTRDWIKSPKSNGYESLHCTVNDNGNWIEVQIRSRRMDDIAEKGIAAHWAYKKEGFVSSEDNEMDRWLEKIQDILSDPDVNSLELLDIVHEDLLTTKIYVFTPNGDQKSILKGATALDFAYSIHSEIGRKAIAAKVNTRLVPLHHVLRSGDEVEILTTENGQPQKEWLSFVRTKRAKDDIQSFFKTPGQKKSRKREAPREVTLTLSGKARPELLNDILRTCGRLSGSQLEHFQLDTHDTIFNGDIRFKARNKWEMEEWVKTLQEIAGVEKVTLSKEK